MKFYYQLFLIIALANIRNCSGQTVYTSSYRQYNLKELVKNKSFDSEIAQIEKKAFNLVNMLPQNYVKDGTVDYSTYMQEGINKYDNVIFPNFPILINEKGLNMRSNMRVIFKPNSLLLLKPSTLKSYKVIALYNVDNVRIYNLTIKGDRFKHLGVGGEWGMGISIRAASNVVLVNPYIRECWGDGIYIGQIKNVPSKNVEIYNAYIDYNRRNGISVISVDGLKLVNPVISNTYGANPMAGIDFEPNNNNDLIRNVKVENPITFNVKNGILVVLGTLAGINKQSVDLQINNHIDYYSYTGFYISGFNKPMDGMPLGGKISIVNPQWKYNVQPFRKKKQYQYAPLVEFKNMKIIQALKSGKDELKVDSVEKVKKLFPLGGRISFN